MFIYLDKKNASRHKKMSWPGSQLHPIMHFAYDPHHQSYLQLNRSFLLVGILHSYSIYICMYHGFNYHKFLQQL